MKPVATGPITFANEGAMPSQLKMRTRSVPSLAASPAARWIVSMPVLVPAPVAIAAAHSSSRCAVPSTPVEARANRQPSTVKATDR